jgi:hypothetical protein
LIINIKIIDVVMRLRKNKKGIEAGGFSTIVKIAITLIAGGLFFWMVWVIIMTYI